MQRKSLLSWYIYIVPWELILQSIQSGISWLRRWKFRARSLVDSAESWIIGYCAKPSRMNRLTSILPVLVIQSAIKPKKTIIILRNWIGKVQGQTAVEFFNNSAAVCFTDKIPTRKTWKILKVRYSEESIGQFLWNFSTSPVRILLEE